MQLTENQALELWRRTIVAGVRNDVPDLSARQMAVLLTVYLKSPPHTVRGLASALQISKPAITRSLDRLSDLGLLRRKIDESDRRSVLIQRTLSGSVFLREYGEIIVGSGYDMDDRPDFVGVIPFEAAVSGGIA
jgi:DNA-binding MarR family transcriptional regulator